MLLAWFGADREGPALAFLAAGIGGLALIETLATRPGTRLPRAIAWTAAAFWGWGLASWVWSWDRHGTFRELLAWGSALLAGWLAARHAEGDERESLVYALATAGAIVALASARVTRQEGAGLVAMGGIFHRTNDLAGFLLLVLPCALWALGRAPRRAILPWAVAASGMAAELILTRSRGAWLAALIALVVGAGIAIGRRSVESWRRLLLCGALTAALVAPFAARAHLASRLRSTEQLAGQITENSWRWRESVVEGSLALAGQHPLLGTGLGTFHIAYHTVQRQSGYYAHDAHDAYLQMLDELGIPGLLLFLLLLSLAVHATFTAVRNDPGDHRLPVVLGLLASALHAAVDLDWQVPAMLLPFWLLAGVLVAKKRSEGDSSRMAIVPAYLGGLALLIGALMLSQGQRLQARAQALLATDPAGARIAFARLSHLWPWSPAGSVGLVAADRTLGDGDGAQAAALRAVSLAPHAPGPRLVLGELQIDRGQYAAAARTLTMLVREAPYYHPEIYNQLSVAQVRSGDVKAGIESLRAALGAFPAADLPHYEAYTPGDRPELAETCLRLVQLGAATPADRAELGNLLAGGGSYFEPALAEPWRTAQGFWSAVGGGHRAAALRFAPSLAGWQGLPWHAGPIRGLRIRRLVVRGEEADLSAIVRLGSHDYAAVHHLVADMAGWHLVAIRPGS